MEIGLPLVAQNHLYYRIHEKGRVKDIDSTAHKFKTQQDHPKDMDETSEPAQNIEK